MFFEVVDLPRVPREFRPSSGHCEVETKATLRGRIKNLILLNRSENTILRDPFQCSKPFRIILATERVSGFRPRYHHAYVEPTKPE